tara:strand:- start:83 stop:538 length:456 start_codon:yes stop_codon:yes gene_type:complete
MLPSLLDQDAVVDRDTFRDQIQNLQNVFLTYDQVDCPVTHHFAPGVYAREIRVPAGTIVIGKIHIHAHLNIISKGSGFVATETGREYFNAPYTFTSQVGTKRAVHAITDVIWTTIHLTEKTDLAEIEAEIIAPDYETLDARLSYVKPQELV